ncbi:MAG TPA: hypothetical protein VGH43_08355 [Jatrophihabitans sp.]|jgi:nucleoside diphosphate kinase
MRRELTPAEFDESDGVADWRMVWVPKEDVEARVFYGGRTGRPFGPTVVSFVHSGQLHLTTDRPN